jgi:predicted cupin superfamily sugar epimerase
MRSSLGDLGPAQIIKLLNLRPHPEGGWYGETFRAEAVDDRRPSSTAIYYLLEADQVSAWHRVDAAEVFHWYAGAPLSLTICENGHDCQSVHLGADLKAGQRPQFVVPANWWQTSTSLGAWTLVGCTVAPAFDFAHFELAPPDWRPQPRGVGDKN